MTDQWMIRGVEYSNCNCAYGWGSQFNAPLTQGLCAALDSGYIAEGYFNETQLDGLSYVLLLQWPHEMVAGNGKQQIFIDQRANSAQREALRKILHGESTRPGATHFFSFNRRISTVLAPQFVPIDIAINVPARKAMVYVPGILESFGQPLRDPVTGTAVRACINLPDGSETTRAEVGNGSTWAQAGITLNLSESYGQFNLLHVNQDGWVRT
ncbi:DUF1326 domain-containing protein [Candidatus Nitronereus thalassa]|uniref:DUF1326 domain-containing protein n=1 Tax=Candidatus Nitronereus thalassa TaxID=3020898 RepID=A0ABU3KCE6_9BACT|nr:DUF1326 domain-containing protein [Candidatus Nitronereus thalassa]MDT7044096.1 DUF1326 domain-containing protein [Candidatus Nitronereus thalassa]